MNCDMLLFWMTHKGEGSWGGFKGAIEEISEPDVDFTALRRSTRIRMSDLSFANFFMDGSQGWRILPTVLAGLVDKEGVAVLCGGRTPALVDKLKRSAEACHCEVEEESRQDCPSLIQLHGESEGLAAVAAETDIAFIPHYGLIAAQTLRPIQTTMECAPTEPAPRNWKVRSFDLRGCKWVDSMLPNAACEFIPAYGRPRYFLHRRKGKLVSMSKREAVYASAMIRSIRLIDYDASAMQLSTPWSAPLPEPYSRAASLCTGRAAEQVDGRLIFFGVTPDVAALIMVAAGQPHPSFTISAGGGSR